MKDLVSTCLEMSATGMEKNRILMLKYHEKKTTRIEGVLLNCSFYNTFR